MSMVSDLLFGVMPDLPGGAPRKHTCLSDARKAFKESTSSRYRAGEGNCLQRLHSPAES